MPARDRLDAVLAAGEPRLQCNEIDHLRQRQGDHREIDALAADRQPPETRSEEGRHGGAGEDPELRRKTPYLDGMSGDVGGPAEKGRMAERPQPDIDNQPTESPGNKSEAERLH